MRTGASATIFEALEITTREISYIIERATPIRRALSSIPTERERNYGDSSVCILKKLQGKAWRLNDITVAVT